MNRYLLPAAAVLALAIGATLFITRPASNVGPARTPAASPSERPTPSLPTARRLAPTAVIDLAGKVKGAISIAADGDDVWIGIDGGLIHVDARTSATRQIDVPHMLTSNGQIAARAGELWIADHNGQRIERIDPATGTVLLEASAPGVVELSFVGDDLWLGSHLDGGMHPVDRKTGGIGPMVGTIRSLPSPSCPECRATFGLDQLWTGDGKATRATAATINRIDPVTGDVAGTISVPAGSGCGVSGSFPDNIWAGCPTLPGDTHETSMTAVRIDPATSTVAATARVPAMYYGVAAVVDGEPWMFILSADDSGNTVTTLVAVDPATGRLVSALDLGRIGVDMAVVTSGAVWMSDEEGDRVVRYDLTALRN